MSDIGSDFGEVILSEYEDINFVEQRKEVDETVGLQIENFYLGDSLKHPNGECNGEWE